MSDVFQNLDWSILTDIILSIIPVLLCITIHELAHGYTAFQLGDNTAKEMGRLTLNPVKHIDPVGLLAMAVFGFGWAKPVPVNMMSFKKPKRDMAITALAGPISNIILALIVLIILGFLIIPLGGFSPVQSDFQRITLNIIQRTAYLSIALAIFNMIPIPPLDGSKVLFSLVSDETYFKLMQYERYGMILLLVLMVTGIFSSTLGTLVSAIFEKFLVVTQFILDMVS